MPSYRERREAGEFESGKAAKAKPVSVEEWAAAEDEEAPSEPAPKPKRTGVKVATDE